MLGLSPRRVLRRDWCRLIRHARAEAWRRGRFLKVTRLGHADRHDPRPDTALLVGHSFGGSRCVSIAKTLERVPWLVLIEPVPRRGWGICDAKSFRLPGSVRNAACFLRRRFWGMPPFSHPIRRAAGRFVNERLGVWHDAIVRRPEVRATLTQAVADVCG